MRIDQGIDVVEKSVVSYGGVQAGYLEKDVLGSHCLSQWLRHSDSWVL